MQCTLKDIYVYVDVQCSFRVGQMCVLKGKYLQMLKGALRNAVPSSIPWGELSPFPNRIV